MCRSSENCQLWKYAQVRQALLRGTEAWQPDGVRLSALGALAALLACGENRDAMWSDEELRQALVLGAAEQVAVEGAQVGVSSLSCRRRGL